MILLGEIKLQYNQQLDGYYLYLHLYRDLEQTLQQLGLFWRERGCELTLESSYKEGDILPYQLRNTGS
jgi:hypothetical protein